MDYVVKTRILLNTNFNISEFNDLMYEDAKPDIIEDIKSVIEEDPPLCGYIDGDLTFRFLSNYKVLLTYDFNCNDENGAEAESFSKSCMEDIRKELEGKGYRIDRISCTAEEMDMEWLDKLEDMVFQSQNGRHKAFDGSYIRKGWNESIRHCLEKGLVWRKNKSIMGN